MHGCAILLIYRHGAAIYIHLCGTLPIILTFFGHCPIITSIVVESAGQCPHIITINFACHYHFRIVFHWLWCNVVNYCNWLCSSTGGIFMSHSYNLQGTPHAILCPLFHGLRATMGYRDWCTLCHSFTQWVGQTTKLIFFRTSLWKWKKTLFCCSKNTACFTPLNLDF